MEFITDKIKWMMDQDGCWVFIRHPDRETVQKFILALDDKPYDVKVKPHRKRRSLDANAYAWSLINELANVMRISKDECYQLMLKRYGQSSVVSVVEEATETFMASVKYREELGRATLNDKEFVHIRVFKGSSQFDSREMAILIDGIVSECKELGIETMTPAEIERMKGEWNGRA